MYAKRWTAWLLALCLTVSALLPMGTALHAKAAPAEETAPADTWTSVQEILNRYPAVWTNENYEGWNNGGRVPHTALLGNGDVGVTSAGTKGEKTFVLTKSDFRPRNRSNMRAGGITLREKPMESTAVTETFLNGKITNVTSSQAFLGLTADRTCKGYVKGMEGFVSAGRYSSKEFLTYEFAEPVTIGHWIVVCDKESRGQAKEYMKGLSLYYSDDGAAWTKADTVANNTKGVIDHYLTTPITAKFVKLTDTVPNNDRTRVAQVFFYAENGPAAGVEGTTFVEGDGSGVFTMNLTGKIANVTSSNCLYGKTESFGPQRTYMGYTPKMEGFVSSGTAGNFLTYEFTEAVTISRWIMAMDGTRGYPNNNMKTVTLSYSDDGKTWTKADAVTGNTESILDRTLETPFKAKFVRFDNLTSRDGKTRITQVFLYGDKGAGFYEGTAPTTITLQQPQTRPVPSVKVDFEERMDLATATISDTMMMGSAAVELQTWQAANDNLTVTAIRSVSDQPVTLEAETWVRHGKSTVLEYWSKGVTEEDGRVFLESRTNIPEPLNNYYHNNVYHDTTPRYMTEVALSTRVVGAEASAPVLGDVLRDGSEVIGTRMTQSFTLQPQQTVYVVTAVGGGGMTYDENGSLREGEVLPRQEAGDLLAKCADGAAVEALHQEHAQWWKDYWCTSYVDFGTENRDLNDIQRYYFTAQYLMGAGMRADKLAAGFSGIWVPEASAAFHNDYHLNYNWLGNYYGVAGSNRPELLLPAQQGMLDYMGTAERNAADTSWIRHLVPAECQRLIDNKIKAGIIDETNGIADAMLTPVGIGPWGMSLFRTLNFEACCASFNVFPMIEYYEYTLDETYLPQVYEYLRKCVNFYAAWVVREELDNGDYTYAMYCGYNERSFSKNPAIEVAAFREVLAHLIQYSRILGRDADKREGWIEMYKHLPDHPLVDVGGKTVFNVCDLGGKLQNAPNTDKLGPYVQPRNPVENSFLNIIVMDPMLPMNLYNHYSSREDLQIMQNTVELYARSTRQGANGWNQNNNFAKIFTEAVESGVPASTVVPNFAATIRMKHQANNYVDDGTHGYEKIGAVDAVNQMMLNSECGMIEVFPNWLEGQDASFHNLGAKRGFSVSARYDGTAKETVSVEITSKKGAQCQLVCPWLANGVTVTDSDGQNVPVTQGRIPYYDLMSLVEENYTPTGYHDGRLYSFPTEAGKTYTITKSDEHIHTGVLVPGTAATCTEEGFADYYRCPCGKTYADAACTQEINLETWNGKLPALGHKWSDVRYTWSADCDLCMAEHTCENDKTHVETAEADLIEEEILTAPTETAEGKARYTATFREDWAAAAQQELVLPRLGDRTDRFLNDTIKTATAGEAYGSFTAERTYEGYRKDMEGYVSANPSGNFVTYEFRKPVTIGHWIMLCDGARTGSAAKNNVRDLRVQWSMDGQTWTDLDSVSGNTEHIIDHYLTQPVHARYVKFDNFVMNNPDDQRVRINQVYFYEDNGPARTGGEGTFAAGNGSGVFDANLTRFIVEARAGGFNAANPGTGTRPGFDPERTITGFLGDSYETSTYEGWVSNSNSGCTTLEYTFKEPMKVARWIAVTDGDRPGSGSANNVRKYGLEYKAKATDTAWIRLYDQMPDQGETIVDRNLTEPILAEAVRLTMWVPGKDTVSRVRQVYFYSEPGTEEELQNHTGMYMGPVQPAELPSHAHAAYARQIAGVPAACEAEGKQTYWRCGCGKVFEDEACMTEITEPDTWGILPALGHQYGDPSYTWSEDNSACTAKRVCSRDDAHVEIADAVVSSVINKEPTATEPGKQTFTAAFAEDWAEDQIREVELPIDADAANAGRLKTLELVGKTLTPEFASGIYTYDLVLEAPETITIRAEAFTGQDRVIIRLNGRNYENAAAGVAVEVRPGDVITVSCGHTDVQDDKETFHEYTINVKKPASEGRIIKGSHSLSLDDIIVINEYVKYEGYTEEYMMENGGLLIWDHAVTDEEAKITSETAVNKQGLLKSDKGLGQRTDGIVSTKYAEPLYLRFYVKNEDNSYAYGPIIKRSVRDWCLGAIDQNLATKQTAIQLLHFGAAAQQYFAYRTDALCNEGVEAGRAWDEALLTPADSTRLPAFDHASTNDFRVSRSVSLDEEIKANFYAKDVPFNIASAELIFWDGADAEQVVYPMTLTDRGYGAQTRGFTSVEYETTVYVCVRLTDAQGQVHDSEIVPFSVEDYAALVLEKSQSETLKTAMQQLVLYGEEARTWKNTK